MAGGHSRGDEDAAWVQYNAAWESIEGSGGAQFGPVTVRGKRRRATAGDRATSATFSATLHLLEALFLLQCVRAALILTPPLRAHCLLRVQDCDIPWPPSVAGMLSKLALLEMASRAGHRSGPAEKNSSTRAGDERCGKREAGSGEAAYAAYKCAAAVRQSMDADWRRVCCSGERC